MFIGSIYEKKKCRIWPFIKKEKKEKSRGLLYMILKKLRLYKSVR